MLPHVSIKFDNGAIGTVTSSTDGIFGLCASASGVGTTFFLETPYIIKGMVDVARLGILPEVENYRLYKTLKEFYQEAGEGSELWLMGFSKKTKVSDWFTTDPVTGKTPVHQLLDAANGRLNMIFTSYAPMASYVPVIENGIDADVFETANLAQILADSYTSSKYAPFTVLLEGYAYTGNIIDLDDLGQKSFNRVGILIGDTEKRTGTPTSYGSAIAVLAGRLSKIQVHINIGKVKDGSLSNLKAYVLDEPVELADVESLHSKGYITFRTHQGKSGYFFADDPLATDIADDYHYITRRRVIDKAYRIAYNVMSTYILDEISRTNEGTIAPIYARTIESHLVSEIAANMTARGELSANALDKNDFGVIAKVNTTLNVVSTSRVEVSLRVRPYGYGRWFDVLLGFEV